MPGSLRGGSGAKSASSAPSAAPSAARGGSREGSGAASSAPSKRLSLFLRAAVFDFVLVLAVSAALAFTVSYGFNSAPDLRGNVTLAVATCAGLLVILYAGSWSRRAIPLAAIVYAAAAVGIVVVISGMSPAPAELFVDGQVNDVEDNYAVLGIVYAVVPAIVYLLSRRTWGVAILLFLGALACGTIQFLYRDWISAEPGTVASLVVYVGIGALFVMQGYRQGVMKSRVVKRTSFLTAFAFGVLGAVACVAVGAGVFYGIIAGLGLNTVDSKPFEDYYQRPVIEYDGTYQQQQIYDPDLGTSTLSDEIDYTNDDEYGATSDQDVSSGGGFSFVNSIVDTLNIDDWQESFEAIRFDIPLPLQVLLWMLPFLLIALVVYLRYRQRERRLKKLEQYSFAQRTALLYNFFIKRFERLKVEKPPTLTPLEFALASSNELAGFMRNASQADFIGITLIYQRAVYGAGNVSEDDYQQVVGYYRSFFKNAHLRMGHVKWALRGFWRI